MVNNNELIAKFMQHKPTFEVYVDNVLTKLENPIREYNNDWNALMECVDKCFSIDANYGLHKDIEDALIYKSENRILNVYKAVVNFIEVYNESFKQEFVR